MIPRPRSGAGGTNARFGQWDHQSIDNAIARRLRETDFEGWGDLMLSGNRHWLEYDSVALVVLFVGIGFVALIVLGI